MSASREKKTRQELASQGIKDPKAIREAEEKAKQRKANRLYGGIAVLFVVVAVVLLLVNAGVFYRDPDAVTIGGENYSAAQVNYYYQGLYNSIANAGYYGLDTSKPLDQQNLNDTAKLLLQVTDEGDITWDQFLRDEAIRQLSTNAMAAREAEANGQEPPYSQDEINQAQNNANTGGASGGDSGFMWPVPCSTRVTSRYGNRADPFTGQTRYHSGIDIDGFGNDGAPIVAAASGVVVTASSDSGYGNYVIINHGDTSTVYAHMSGFAVSTGDYVSQGQTVGYLGATGRATGTHLHFEVYVGDGRVDPAAYFSGITYYNC